MSLRLELPGPRALRVWRRNLLVARVTWWSNVIPPAFEPVLYLLAFGTGLGALLRPIVYEGRAVGYVAFLAPGILAVAVMFWSVFETLYSAFVRMYYQKTYEGLVATPLSLGDVVGGEILWATTKGLAVALVMLAVIAPFGVLAWPGTLAVPLLALAGGFLFASLGLCFTALCPTIDTINLPLFLLVWPMFLFSGTFFPIDQIPVWARPVAQALPLTWLARAMRAATLGTLGPRHAIDAALLVGVGLALSLVALVLMRRRLVS